MRSELTEAQRAEHLAKRKEIWEVRENQVAQVDPPESGYKKPPRQSKGYAAETAEATGLSKATINRAIARAEGTTQEARDIIRGTKLDTGVIA